MNNLISTLEINPISKEIGKNSSNFLKEDIVKYILSNNIMIVNFMYVGGDKQLKELNFVIHSEEYLRDILTYGERVDGSSLFPFINPESSDLYVIPRFSSAFMHPFSKEKTVCLLCSFFDKDGNMLENSPEYVLNKAHKKFTEVSGGMEFHAMGELEFYIIGENDNLFITKDQKGYHSSTPFNKYEQFRIEVIKILAELGAKIKYAHSEVGNFTIDNKIYEQNEIEFLPIKAEDAAEQLVIGKWVINNLAYKYGLNVTFAPKIISGKAGSGMHIHTKIVKNGVNMYRNENGLTDIAKKTIAGFMKLATSLTAFGNTNPISYLRLVPHQEAPTIVCWGDRNRSVLVRVPLGWTSAIDMCKIINPLEEKSTKIESRQTIEFRCPDGTADIYLLIAGLIVAATLGFETDDYLDIANKTYIDVNIHKDENNAIMQTLDKLPTNCTESADILDRNRQLFSKHGIYPESILDYTIKTLRGYNDDKLRDDIKEKPEILNKIIEEFFYY